MSHHPTERLRDALDAAGSADSVTVSTMDLRRLLNGGQAVKEVGTSTFAKERAAINERLDQRRQTADIDPAKLAHLLTDMPRLSAHLKAFRLRTATAQVDLAKSVSPMWGRDTIAALETGYIPPYVEAGLLDLFRIIEFVPRTS